MSPSLDLLLQMAALALQGQTVLVTGGSGGIGSAISSLFARSGCNVIVTGSNQAKLNAFVRDLPRKDGARVWGFACDLRKRDEVEAMVLKAANECPPIDVLINNAGYALSATAPFWEQDLDDVESVLDVNLTGLMYVTQAVMKHHMMSRSLRPSGTILNVSSITGHQAPLKHFFETSYHTSKAAVEGFTNVLRHETINTDIRVLLHRPGTVRTEFHSRRHGYDADKTAATYEGYTPLVAEDIAVGVLWQCLQPARVSVVLMETLPTAQRSLYAADNEWEGRHGQERCDDWQ